jgi:hypothetical protein
MFPLISSLRYVRSGKLFEAPVVMLYEQGAGYVIFNPGGWGRSFITNTLVDEFMLNFVKIRRALMSQARKTFSPKIAIRFTFRTPPMVYFHKAWRECGEDKDVLEWFLDRLPC